MRIYHYGRSGLVRTAMLSFAAVIMVLSWTAGAAAQDNYDDIHVLEWADPNSQPMTYDEWRQLVGEPQPFESNFVAQYAPVGGTRTEVDFSILVNAGLYPDIIASLDQYIFDLTREGYSVTLYTIFGGTPEDFRAFLQGRYDEGMEGCVFIGDLPVAWFEHDYWGHEEFPCDLFYMDMDGVWIDNDSDGKYDQHTGDVAPEIWLGRLTASPLTYGGADEVTLLENYFDKDHRYRTGQIQLDDRGLMYVDDDWQGSGGYWGNCMRQAYDSVVMINDPYVTTSYDYEDRLTHNYEFIQVCAHSSPNLHYFKIPGGSGGYTYYYEVIGIDPVGLFYNLFACSNARFIATNYMAGWYIFCDTYGLGAIGSTKTGSMLNFQYFYGPFGSGATFGEALSDWFTQIAVGGFSNGEIAWHYGMTACGDPTLLKDPVMPTPITVWVDGTYGDDHSGDGSRNNPYQTITMAISETVDGDTIQVRPGRYYENLEYGGKAIIINGQFGADLTVLEPRDVHRPAVIMDGIASVGARFAGFTVTNFEADYVIGMSNSANPLVEKCIFADNRPNPYGSTLGSSVIRINSSYPTVMRNAFYRNTLPVCVYLILGSAKIFNNTLDDNLAGMHAEHEGIAYNNIVTNSERQGFSGFWHTEEIDYNDVWNNNPDYDFPNPGPNNISADPLFIDPHADRYYLRFGSPCIDAGNPEAGFNDPDGSRNDIGAYQAVYVIQFGIRSIQEAIDRGNGSDVVVYPGDYTENIDFHGLDIKLMTLEGPSETNLAPSNRTLPVVRMVGGEDESSMFSGFTVSKCEAVFSFEIGGDAAPVIRDNVFRDNKGDLGSRSSGVIRTLDNTEPIITRNLFVDNMDMACVWVLGARTEVVNNTMDSNYRGLFGIGHAYVKNNIITNCIEYGVSGSWDELDYNDVWHNHPDYDNANPGLHNISADPLYNPDYTLSSHSPCIDAGDPRPRYLDPDGTRNDMGAYPYYGDGGFPKAAAAVPMTYSLDQNYPNPFNPITTIHFTLAQPGPVEVAVFNILGQRVVTLIDAPMNAGRHSVVWNGADAAGQPVASGMYFYRLTAAEFQDSKKMVLLK